MTHFGVVALFTFGVVGLLGCASKSADDPFKDMPRRSLAEARTSLPEPSVVGAFVFDGVSESDGGPIGSLRLTVEPGEYQGEAAWFVAQESQERSGPDRPIETVRTTAWYSADLRILRRDALPASTSEASDPHGDATWTLAGALIFLRSCPADVAAYVDEPPRDQPPFCVNVSRIDADGTIQASAPTIDEFMVHAVLRGPNRDVVEIGRSLGWHLMGKIVARGPSAK